MDISIIVPCWNVEKYIKNLLLSFHMLDLNDISYEILFVVEDDTNDSTEEIIHKYMYDMNYDILHSNGHTVGIARNVGLDEAIGEFIWFVDSDDWLINPEVIRLSLNYFRQHSQDILKIKFVSNYFTREHYSMVWQYIFRYDFLTDLRFGTMKYYEDNDFMERAFDKLGNKELDILTIPSYFYNYNRPGSNTSILQGKV